MRIRREVGYCIVFVAIALSFQNCGTSGGFQPTSLFGAAASNSEPKVSGSSMPRGVYSVMDYGATGNGSADDTPAIQNAINAAQARGGIVFFPVGNYKVNGTLSIQKGVSVRGLGYKGQFSNINNSGTIQNLSLSSLPDCSCLIETNPGSTLFNVQTPDAVQFQNLVIYYPAVNAGSGATGIAINAGEDLGNTQSLIRDTLIYGADRGISFTNAASWIVDNDVIYNSVSYGLVHDATYGTVGDPQQNDSIHNAASTGDWEVSNSSFISNSTRAAYAHVFLASGGGGRLIQNLMNENGNGYGLFVSPQNYVVPTTGDSNVVGYNVEPIVFVNNIIQGANIAINFQPAAGSNGESTQGVITDNQISANIFYHTQPWNDGTPWIQDWTIFGNTVNCLGSSSSYCIILDGANNMNFTSNTLYLPNGAQVSYLKSSTTGNIQIANNVSKSGGFSVSAAGLGVHSPFFGVQSNGLVAPQGPKTFNVMDYGAIGDGVHDDSAGIQQAILSAEEDAGTVFFPAGKFLISRSLSITAPISVQGIGYQSALSNFTTTNSAAIPVSINSLEGCSCIIQSNRSSNIFTVTTSGAVQVMDLELYYDFNPQVAAASTGVAAVSINGSSQSVVRDVFIQGPDQGISFSNSSNWLVDNVFFYDCLSYGIYENGTAINSGGWQILNSTFETGTFNNYSHIAVIGGGSGNIIGNKLNDAGNSSSSLQVMNGILISPSSSQEKINVIGNSIEGCYDGISFSELPNNATSSGGSVVGNQIWAHFTPILGTADKSTSRWIDNWSVWGNELFSDGSASHSDVLTYNINISGSSGLSVDGNLFGSGTAVTAPSAFEPNSNSNLQAGFNLDGDAQ